MRSFQLIFITLIIFVSTNFAQGKYLNRGEDGYGFGAGFATNENMSAFAGGFGYSIQGIFDLGFYIGHTGFDQQLFDEDVSATLFSPFISFYPLKQNAEIPFSVSLDAGYQWQFYSNDVFDENEIEMTGRYFNIGGTVFGYVKTSTYFGIQPTIGVRYTTGEIEIENDNDLSFGSDNDITTFIIGVDLVFETISTNKLVIVPRVAVNDNNTTVGLGLEYIFN